MYAMHVCMYTCMNTQVCIHMHTVSYAFVHTYIHICSLCLWLALGLEQRLSETSEKCEKQRAFAARLLARFCFCFPQYVLSQPTPHPCVCVFVCVCVCERVCICYVRACVHVCAADV